MDRGGEKKWIVKTLDGQVLGPYSTERVLSMIRKGEFTGEEQISLFPKTEWFAISSAPEFYDLLLESLEGAPPSEPAPSEPLESTPEPSVSQNKREGRAHRVSETSKKSKPKEESVPQQPTIELKKSKKVLRKAKVKRGSKLVFLLAIALIMAAAYLMVDTTPRAQAIRLLVPRTDRPSLPDDQLKTMTQKAVGQFVLNDFHSLILAQNSLVQVYEGDTKNSAALALLCLTYFELWPFAYQDSKDLDSLTKLTQLASRIDPIGSDGTTCRVVDLLLRGRPLEATSLVDSVIESMGSSDTPPIVFYYLKSILLNSRKEFNSAINYAQAAEQLWPIWLGPKILQAEAAMSSNQSDLAVRALNSVLKSNPQHEKAQALLGIVEMRDLKNYERGQQFIDAALKDPTKLSPQVASESYLTLAEYHLQRADSAKALSLAKKAYSKNTTNQRARALIVQLGGEKSLSETKLVDRQLIYEGDQLVREGDCASAQALYKAAYEVNKKNPMAAMKAAECLWRLGLATEAIDWLNRALTADPKLIDAYVLLADYYSQRYLFQAAGRSLAAANSVDPINYKVFRGLARTELRRRNGKGAVAYAEQAVGLYEADVESYVILARAHILMNDFNSAVIASRKAKEIDINSRDAQIVHADSLFGSQGALVAIDYMSRLVSGYPLIVDYRLALADLYFRDQKYGQAKELYSQVVRMQEKPKEALVKLGRVLEVEGALDLAIGNYFKAAALDPSDPEPLYMAGQLYLNSNKPQEARKQFERILNINKEYPLVNYNIGKAALLVGDTKTAIDQAKIEMQKNPYLAEPYILAAQAYDKMGQYTLCASEYQKAVKISPQGSMMYVQMARCYRLSGNLDAAASMIRIANSQESGNPEVWKEQAQIFESKGDVIRAIEAYNQYLVLAPNAADVQRIRDRIQSLAD